jgi:hypothetical protein
MGVSVADIWTDNADKKYRDFGHHFYKTITITFSIN